MLMSSDGVGAVLALPSTTPCCVMSTFSAARRVLGAAGASCFAWLVASIDSDEVLERMTVVFAACKVRSELRLEKTTYQA